MCISRNLTFSMWKKIPRLESLLQQYNKFRGTAQNSTDCGKMWFPIMIDIAMSECLHRNIFSCRLKTDSDVNIVTMLASRSTPE